MEYSVKKRVIPTWNISEPGAVGARYEALDEPHF